MRSIAPKSRIDRVLHRNRAAEPSIGQLLDRAEDRVEPRRAADHRPARAPSGREIRLRQARKGNDWRIGGEAADRRHRTIEPEVAVDLVRQDREAVLIREVDQRAPRGRRIQRAGGIVRIDHDERARRR